MSSFVNLKSNSLRLTVACDGVRAEAAVAALQRNGGLAQLDARELLYIRSTRKHTSRFARIRQIPGESELLYIKFTGKEQTSPPVMVLRGKSMTS